MDRFVSHYVNRLDAKGRVSIPAPFRAVLQRDGHDGLYLHRALDEPALDCGGHALLREIDALLDGMPLYSPRRDLFAMALLGASQILKIDPDGRIVVSDMIREAAGITDQIAFVGQGHKFQIWEPGRFQARFEAARDELRRLRQSLDQAVTR